MIKHLLKYNLWILFIIMAGVFCWTYFAIKLYVNSGFTAIFIGLAIGIFTALNYDKETAFFYWMAAGISSVFAYYLGKYIIFEFYSGVIDIHADINLPATIGLLLLKTSPTSVGAFVEHHLSNYDFFDFLWPTTTITMAMYHSRKVLFYKQRWHKISKVFKR